MEIKRKTSIALPPEVDKAVEVAAARLGIRKGEVLERAVRDAFPQDIYTARRMMAKQ